MKISRIAAEFIAAMFTALPLMAQELSSLQIYAGMVNLQDIANGEKALPLDDPVVFIDPPFGPEIRSYTVRVPYGVDGITLVMEVDHMNNLGIADFNGDSGKFQALTYDRKMTFEKGLITTFPLQPGNNRLRVSAKFINVEVHKRRHLHA